MSGKRIIATSAAALVAFGTLFVVAGPAFADTAVGDVGLCVGQPAPGGCDSGGGGVTHASPGATVKLGVTFTATSGLPTGQVVDIDSQASFPNAISFSSSDSDYSVENVTKTETCSLDGDITQYNANIVFVPMPAGCAADAGDQLIVTLDNAVMPTLESPISVKVATQYDNTLVTTNSIDVYTVPDAPQSPSATGGLGSVTVAWSAPDSDGGSDITGYDVYCSTSGSPSTADTPTATTDASTFSTEITGITRGTIETCVVTAVNAAGQSSASDTVAAGPTTVPNRPKDVYTLVYSHEIVVHWTRPKVSGGTRITHFLVYCTTTKPAIVDPSDLCKTTRGTATYTTLGGLTNLTRYYIRVVAENANGLSQPSVQVGAVPSQPPSRPRAVQTTPVSGGLGFTFKPPKYDYGVPVQGYFIACATSPDFSDAVYTFVESSPAELDGLTSGTPYYCKVSAMNNAGQVGPNSAVVTGTPL